MELKGKALYNLLKINALDHSKLGVQPWQVEELRSVSTPILLKRLKSAGLDLDEKNFHLYAEEVDSPEDLVDFLCSDESEIEEIDRTYLILFELWRRLLPKKQSLSLICDELDYLIEKYDRETLEDPEALQNALSMLEDILDDACDTQGLTPQAAFQEITKYCAHDLQSFLNDFIIDQIENENETYASELVDAFYDSVSDKKWFDFLRARLFFSTQNEESNRVILRLLEQLNEEPDLDLLMQIIDSLVNQGDVHLFPQAVKQALPLLKMESEFQELLSMCADYFRFLDKEKEEQHILNLLNKRSATKLDASLNLSDKAVKDFSKLLAI